jgi:hypothetical protein
MTKVTLVHRTFGLRFIIFVNEDTTEAPEEQSKCRNATRLLIVFRSGGPNSATRTYLSEFVQLSVLSGHATQILKGEGKVSVGELSYRDAVG